MDSVITAIITAGCMLTRPVNLIRNLEKDVRVLLIKTDELVAREHDIRRVIQRAEHQGNTVSNRVFGLLVRVDTIKDQVSYIAVSIEEHRRCFFNCNSRLKLAKRVVRVSEEVDLLIVETNSFGTELLESPPRAPLLPVPSVFGNLTVKKNMDAILEALRDPLIQTIGILGMAGCGKTSTMMIVHNQLLGNKSIFDLIIWVTVSKDFQFDRVQKEIARQLNLDLSAYEGEANRASVLSKRLKRVNSCLIILDDLWQRIPLDRMGIPPHDNCKIVLTTRSLEVCRAMETQKNIKLQLLSEADSWDLFVSKAGSQVLNPELEPFAVALVHECAGLPLAICTMAYALRGKSDVRVWREAVKDLRRSSTQIRGMEEDVFKMIYFSYSHLRNDSVRKCFLYLSYFPEDYKILNEELVRYWMADGLLKEEGNLESEIDEGFKILKELRDACMFEESSLGGSVRMHDVMRDFAIHIMTERSGILVRAGLGFTQLPNEEQLEEVNKLSMVKNKLEDLPDQPNCPNLSTLLLRDNPLSHSISPSFFTHMPALQILDLSYTKAREMPSSLSDLLNLRALFLQNCGNLERIPSLGKLNNLQLLNLCGTAIKELPQGLDGLLSLISLDVSCTNSLERCAIPNLRLLEELRLDKSHLWQMDSRIVSKRIEEIKCLDCLAIFTMSFVRLDDYLNAIMSLDNERLKDFHIEVLDPTDRSTHESSYFLPKSIFIGNQDIYSRPSTFVIPPNTQNLCLDSCRIPRLSELLCLKNMGLLTKFSIYSCSLTSRDCLIVGDEMEESTLSRLEYLTLNHVKGLAVLWKGVVPPGCMENLRVMEVTQCERLKTLFSGNLLQHLNTIEVIKVSSCEALEELVVGSNEDNNANISSNAFVLSRFHTLILNSLPVFHTISRKKWVCTSLRHLKVFKCPVLHSLPFSGESLANLEIEGETKWWEALEWADDETKRCLRHPFKVIEGIL